MLDQIKRNNEYLRNKFNFEVGFHIDSNHEKPYQISLDQNVYVYSTKRDLINAQQMFIDHCYKRQ